ncbi:MAG: hypothetical protein E6Z06_02100 [Clostridiales bacterium]|uniref:Uncharacterized protein n=1 Tax=Peptococcus niger TaxID=2741 RepID=A0A1G6UPS5_PEPNI|nr:hypothetical protein [Peptococcus niger]MBS5594943.1 hypothetical protein [Clostridiales bacterium]MDU7504416.1 hypothetical protein [Clostridia bacterium]MDU1027975.1 hypothetical protein [Clostridiales bacterium]MDU2292590.1 hypothetical protein [Peptococcus niger]MDU5951658.1 hypothetical protein [Clostridiales bacterium]
MKLPLNYAIINHFVQVDEATADDVIRTLTPEYGNYRGLRRPAVIEAIMTAVSNDLLAESRYEVDAQGVLQVYYKTTPEQRKTIIGYIGNHPY